MLRKGQKNNWRITCSWIILSTLGNWLKNMNERYKRFKLVAKKTRALFIIWFMGFWAIGKMIKLLKKIRLKKKITVINKIASKRIWLWKKHIQTKSKKNISKFLQKVWDSPVLLIFVKLLDHRVRMIQKWFRRSYLKQKIMSTSMNLQWSAVEYALVKTKRHNLSIMNDVINNFIKAGDTSNIVPLPVRMYYMRSYLEVTIPNNMLNRNLIKIIMLKWAII